MEKEGSLVKNSLIAKISNDEYEWILDLYENTKELAEELGTSENNVKCMICRPTLKRKSYHFERIWFKDGEKLNDED